MIRANQPQRTQKAGLTSLQAVSVATKNGAEFLHASDELRPGLKAHFIVLDKDSNEDMRNTNRFLQCGKMEESELWTASTQRVNSRFPNKVSSRAGSA